MTQNQPDVEIALLKLEITYLTTSVNNLVTAVKPIDDRIRVLETYVSRWKGASGALLAIGAIMGWIGSQFVQLWANHH